eukprot:TRINITY_DN42471_c0_g1_i1.p1 TRINITY_DN42471_c0_g1~~TRINITY_DN42471_c0_g1_i1.p1  ORF type:complete len:217 (+),score=76.69 TRINITY_DN42471_c0_g1_i1:129-779(+)
MGGKQSTPEEAPQKAAPSLQDASATLDRRIGDLERKIARSDEEARKLIATQGTNPSAKARAMQVLKMKKMYEQQRDQLVGTQFNLESMAIQQEQAEVTLATAEAMKAATAKLKDQTKKLDVNEVDKLTDGMQDLADELRDIQEALARPTGTDMGAEEDLEAELERLQAEQAMEVLMGAGATAAPAAPAAPAAVAATASPAAAASSAAPAASAPLPA